MRHSFSLLPEKRHTSDDVLLSSSDDYVIRMETLCRRLEASFAAFQRRPQIVPRLLRLLGE